MHVFSDGEVLSHTVYRTASAVQELHTRLLQEDFLLPGGMKFSVPTRVLMSECAIALQESSLKTLLRHCCLMDVHVRSEALQDFLGVCLSLEDVDRSTH